MPNCGLNKLAVFRAIVFVLLSATVSVTASIPRRRIKRQSQWVPKDTSAFAINLARDALGRYVTDIKMGEQEFNFLLSTSSGYTAVAGADCQSCAGQIGTSDLYNVEDSNTASPLGGGTTTIQYGGGASASGSLVKEDCYFKMQNGTQWAYKNQTVVVADNSTNIFGNGAAGVIGLGRSAGNDSIVSTMFRDHPRWQNITFGLALTARQGSDDVQTPAGSMTIRELDDTQYVGDIPWEPVARVDDVPADVPKDWALRMTSWSLKVGKSTIETESGSIAIVEPYFQDIRFPRDEAEKLYLLIDGASSTEDVTGVTWTIPCDQEMTLEVVFGSNTFPLNQQQLVIRSSDGSTCTGAVRGWADRGVKSYLLGSAFAETAYIAYLANPNSDDDQIGLAPRTDGGVISSVSSGSSTPIGAIVGASVGGVVAIFLIIGAVIWYRRRKVKTSPISPIPGNEKTNLSDVISPFVPPNSASPMITTTVSPPTGWVVEQGPIGGERPVDEATIYAARASAASSPSNSPSYLGGYPVVGNRSPKGERFGPMRNSAVTSSSGYSPGPYQDAFQRTYWPSVSSASGGTGATHLAPPPQLDQRMYLDIPDEPAPQYSEVSPATAVASTTDGVLPGTPSGSRPRKN